MPDWRDAGAYDYTRDLTLHQWAWEFLRRNPEYAKAWERYRESLQSVRFDYLMAYSEASLLFHLDEPADPSCDAREAPVIWTDYVGMLLLDEPGTKRLDRFNYEPAESPDVSLTFDVSKPLVPQLELARKHLEKSQERWKAWVAEEAGVDRVHIGPRRRFQPDNFPRLIRLLDAKAQGASIGEMGRSLFPEVTDKRRSAKAALRRAEEIAREGYRDLLLLAP